MGERWSRLGGYMDQLCREGISGCACLVYEGEAERFRRYCGLRDVERGLAPDGDTLYRIYSLTKLYTAVAILQLLEAGKLHMEDPVAEYLPEYRSLQVNEVAANGWNEVREVKSPLQVGHLLTMTSGISYAYDNDGPTMRRTKEAVERFRREHEDFSTREYASLFVTRTKPREFSPIPAPRSCFPYIPHRFSRSRASRSRNMVDFSPRGSHICPLKYSPNSSPETTSMTAASTSYPAP